MNNNTASIDLQSYLTAADQYYRAGQLQDAKSIISQILLQEPRHVPSNYMMGLIAYRTKNYADAEKFIHVTLENSPDNAHVYHKLLGDIFRDQSRWEEATEPYSQALSLKPDYVDVLHSLGTIALIQKNYTEAKLYYERVLTINPAFILSLFNAGITCEALGQSQEATDYYKRCLTIQPTAQIHNSLGIALQMLGENDEALKNYKSAIALQADHTEALNNAGSIYSHAGLYEEARSFYERTLSIQADHPEALNNLGNVLRHIGQPDNAIAYYKQSLKVTPTDTKTFSNLLMTMLYAPSVSAEELFKSAQMYGTTIANPLLRSRKFNNTPDPARKLRIGYVSPDFRNHAVNYFFESLLKLHNKNNFDVYGYSNATNEDDVTERLKKEFYAWRDIRKKNDDEVANIIETDEIDILIDLAGHTGNNNLPVFARKPAPIQVTWLGYPASTGMSAIDYRITDPYAEPEGMTEHLNVETLWRLPQIFCCYSAHVNSPAVISHPPSYDNGYITFGCFNNFSKVTDATLITWKKILEQVPNSRLLLEIAGLEGVKFRDDLDKRLKSLNMPLDRIILEPRKKENQFVLYNKIDIALDPFPCAGGTTSMDTIWMGVPLITLAGHHFVSRMGVTILTNVGLPELIAPNTDEYVEKAVALATDPDRLRSIRHNLRDKVMASPMMDQVTFTRNMEDAYRGMWRKWCVENSHEE